MEREELFALIEERAGPLSGRKREVLTLRYGLDGYGKCRTLEEVARILGITRERVRQIENAALRRPVHLKRRKKIADFYK